MRDWDDERCCEHDQVLSSERRAMRRRRRQAYRGDSWVYPFQVFQDPVTGVLLTSDAPNFAPPGCIPFNLTGAKVTLTIKRHVTDGDTQALAQVSTVTTGLTVTNLVSGQCVATTPPTTFNGFPDEPEPVVYDVQVVTAAGQVATCERGDLLVVPDVTQATS